MEEDGPHEVALWRRALPGSFCNARRAREAMRWAVLEPAVRGDAFAFDAVVGLACGEIFVFFGIAAGPFDYDAVNLVAFGQAEGYWELGLREVTGAALSQAQLGLAFVLDADHGAN